MIDKDIAEGAIGSVGSYDVEIKESKLVAKVGVAQPYGKADLSVEVGLDVVWGLLTSEIKKKIPGQIDDTIIDLIGAAIFGSNPKA